MIEKKLILVMRALFIRTRCLSVSYMHRMHVEGRSNTLEGEEGKKYLCKLILRRFCATDATPLSFTIYESCLT